MPRTISMTMTGNPEMIEYPRMNLMTSIISTTAAFLKKSARTLFSFFIEDDIYYMSS